MALFKFLLLPEKMIKITNSLFFLLYVLMNINLVRVLVKGVYLPVYIQFEWLKKYNIKHIIDVGAYHGDVARALYYLFPKAMIFAFEPNRIHIPKIVNKIPAKKLVIENIGLSDSKGSADFFEYDNEALSSLLPLNKHVTSSNNGQNNWYQKASLQRRSKVMTTTLDQYFNNKKMKGHIFLKIDTQGTELSVLKGGRDFLQRVSIIHIETSFDQLYQGQSLFDEIYQFLIEEGFSFNGESRESHFYPTFGPVNQINGIFINKDLVDIIY